MRFEHVRGFLSFVHSAVTRGDSSPQECLKTIKSHPLLSRYIEDGEELEPNAPVIVNKLLENLREHPLFGDRYRHLTPQVRAQLVQSWTQIVTRHA